MILPQKWPSGALPPPDFNLIENAFAKFKALLRKAAERTFHGLWKTIARLTASSLGMRKLLRRLNVRAW